MKIFTFVFTSLAFIIIISCSGQKIENNMNSNSTVEGKIVKVGNEPFTELGIQINDTSIYVLECDDDLYDSLSSNQGEMYKVYFSKKTETEMGTKIKVTNVEQIK